MGGAGGGQGTQGSGRGRNTHGAALGSTDR